MVILSSRANLRREVEALEKYSADHDLSGYVLLYNLSPKHILPALFYKLIGKTILWYQHELTSYAKKRENNGLFYSATTVLFERVFRILAERRCTGNPTVAADSGIYFCPLLKCVDKTAFSPANRDIDLLYVGRSDWRRSPDVLKELKDRYPGICVVDTRDSANFIDDDELSRLFRRAKYVLNRYTRPIGQSGVTPDALAHGAIVVVSEFEWLTSATQLQEHLLVVPSSLEKTAAAALIIKSIGSYNEAAYSLKFDIVESHVGRKAFLKYWLSFIYGN